MTIEDRVKKWLVLVYLFSMVFINLVLIGYLLKKIIINNWEVLSFAGAIIGGSLTLIGIKWTLNNQNKERFIDGFPKKLLKVDELISVIATLRFNYYTSASLKSNYSDNEIKNTIRQLIELSSDIDGEVYNIVKEIECIADNHIMTLRRPDYLSYEDEGGKELTESAKTKIKDLNDFSRREVVKKHEDIHIYRNNLIKKFGRLTRVT